MLNRTINPLDLHNARRLAIAGSHLTYVYHSDRSSAWQKESIEKWILTNLAGRYYIGNRTFLKNDGTIGVAIAYGFENPSDQTFFMIGCPDA